MTIVGFNFTKISAEKGEKATGKIEISNQIMITDIKDSKMTVTSKDKKGVTFAFTFRTLYNPDYAKIELEGNILTLLDKKQADEAVQQWEKDRKTNKEVITPLMNAILNRANIQALIMSKDLNLPAPIELPKVKVVKK